MALNMPGLFPPKGELQANFDWIDIVGATGFIVFDGFNCPDSSGNNYVLMREAESKDVVNSANKYNIGAGNETAYFTRGTGTGSGGNPTNALDLDFNTSELQLPVILKGEAKVKIGIGADSANQVANCTITAKLRKWDGSSETEIVSVSSNTATLTANIEYSETFSLSVPLTLIKKGEQIRLTIQIATEDVDKVGLAHNPNDTATTIGGTAGVSAGNSRLVLVLPIKINI